ncbi:MAG: hypothetical protein Q8K61_01660 [Gallionella sp.]|nr:hypothetical protein [Gallionella sp.]
MIKILVVIFAGLALQGCASTMKLSPQALGTQQKIFKEGVESVISSKRAVVSVRPASSTHQSDQCPKIIVSVLNNTNESFNFSTEDIQASDGSHPLKVYTYDELVAEEKSRAVWAAVGAALGGAGRSMQAASSGYTYNSGTAAASAYGNNGQSAYGYGTYSGYTYNAAAVQQAQASANAQTNQEIAAINSHTENSLKNLDASALKKTTILPQTWYGGTVTIDPAKSTQNPHKITLIVTAAGEQHEFLLNDSKLEN